MKDPLPTAARLGHLRPRDTRDVRNRSAAYTRMVGFLRWFLPLMVVLTLVGLSVFPMLSSQDIAALAVQHVPNLMVEHLHLTGRDERNQAYSLTAARALQAKDAPNANTVDLVRPEAEITLDGGNWIAGQAAQGRFDQTDKTLWLGGKVEFFHDKGYRIISDEMRVDMEKKAAWSEKPVLIQGSFGEIRGQGFRLLNAGEVFVVTGHATAKLDLQPKK